MPSSPKTSSQLCRKIVSRGEELGLGKGEYQKIDSLARLLYGELYLLYTRRARVLYICTLHRSHPVELMTRKKKNSDSIRHRGCWEHPLSLTQVSGSEDFHMYNYDSSRQEDTRESK